MSRATATQTVYTKFERISSEGLPVIAAARVERRVENGSKLDLGERDGQGLSSDVAATIERDSRRGPCSRRLERRSPNFGEARRVSLDARQDRHARERLGQVS